MELTHFGHSCLLVEHAGARVLVDPGNFSHGFEGLTGLDAVLVTHQHPDHADPARIGRLIADNPDAALYSDPQSAQLLDGPWTAVHPGDEWRIGDLVMRGTGGRHAVIHPEMPVVDNVAYLFGDAEHPARLMHPGDSFYIPFVDVDVLAIPAAAPWAKISESVDYLRAVAPRVAVPIHHGIVAEPAQPIFFGRLTELAPEGTELRLPRYETAVEL